MTTDIYSVIVVRLTTLVFQHSCPKGLVLAKNRALAISAR